MSHYLISEASRLVDEESHVLRYWEEELALKIPRNDLGHRYYTEVQLDIFRTIKELKRQGYQLKEIKQSLEEMESSSRGLEGEVKDKLPMILPAEEHSTTVEMNVIVEEPENMQQARMREFKQLMTDIFTDAVASELNRISGEITEEVSNRVIKEMNYLDREREEREDERFRELDSVIRSRQLKGKYRAEAAATMTNGKGKHRRWKK